MRSASWPTAPCSWPKTPAWFLAEDAGLLGIIAEEATRGIRVRLALGDPGSSAIAQRGQEEGIGDAMAAKIRNALTLYCPLPEYESVEIRLHQTILYNSIYRADGRVLVNQHAYGIPASHSPVYCFRETEKGDMATAYVGSFERVWATAQATQRAADDRWAGPEGLGGSHRA